LQKYNCLSFIRPTFVIGAVMYFAYNYLVVWNCKISFKACNYY